MKRFLSISFIVVIASITLLLTALNRWEFTAAIPKASNRESLGRDNPANNIVSKRLEARAVSLASFCKVNGYNSSICFMIDMNVPSGKERFFLYSIQTKQIIDAGLVTHGSGSISGSEELVFSNTPGSNCTSLGKYRIGKEYYGRFGLAYKLHGLESSNSNAFKRAVVLHAHHCVPQVEVYPLPICPSLGCPTISVPFLQTLKTYIDASTRPVLLYIYR